MQNAQYLSHSAFHNCFVSYIPLIQKIITSVLIKGSCRTFNKAKNSPLRLKGNHNRSQWYRQYNVSPDTFLYIYLTCFVIYLYVKSASNDWYSLGFLSFISHSIVFTRSSVFILHPPRKRSSVAHIAAIGVLLSEAAIPPRN